MKRLSLVVPTYNESENIAALLPRLAAVLDPARDEVLVVDDGSPDGTAAAAEKAASALPPGFVRVVRRAGPRGLSASVVDGFDAAGGRFLAAMDADLSHDETRLPELVRALEEGRDVAVGSRRVDGGGADRWPFHRRAFSNLATGCVRVLLDVPIRDPMSGFFAVRRRVFADSRPLLRPRGYKILLEILAKSGARRVVEVPYVFKDRRQGYSKLSLSVVASYGRQLASLALGRRIAVVRHFWHVSRYRKVSALLAPGTLLDIGCGRPCETMPDGAFLLREGRGVGLDEKMCDMPAPFVRGDAARLPFRDGAFDNVVAMEVLEHVPDPDAVLAEVRRVLKDGGTFVMSVPRETPLWNFLWFFWERTAGRLWRGTHLGGVHHREWPRLLARRFAPGRRAVSLGYNAVFQAMKRGNP